MMFIGQIGHRQGRGLSGMSRSRLFFIIVIFPRKSAALASHSGTAHHLQCGVLHTIDHTLRAWSSSQRATVSFAVVAFYACSLLYPQKYFSKDVWWEWLFKIQSLFGILWYNIRHMFSHVTPLLSPTIVFQPLIQCLLLKMSTSVIQCSAEFSYQCRWIAILNSNSCCIIYRARK